MTSTSLLVQGTRKPLFTKSYTELMEWTQILKFSLGARHHRQKGSYWLGGRQTCYLHIHQVWYQLEYFRAVGRLWRQKPQKLVSDSLCRRPVEVQRPKQNSSMRCESSHEGLKNFWYYNTHNWNKPSDSIGEYVNKKQFEAESRNIQNFGTSNWQMMVL